MATLGQIKDGIDHTVENRIPGIKGYGDISDVVQAPAMVVMPARDTADFTGAMGRGLVTWRFDIYILVPRGEVTSAQNKLDQYISPSGPLSIPEVLFHNADLGLNDGTDAFAEGVREYGGKFTTARIEHVGAILRVIVRSPGK